MRALLFFVLSWPLLLPAQTYFYIDEIVVVPAEPTPADEVSIQLIGNLSNTGSYIVSTDATVTGSTVDITVVAASEGGLDVLVPHTETISVGQLPAGTYDIAFSLNSSGILVSPVPTSFTVAGGDPCAAISIEHVIHQTFSDTAVEVFVLNPTAQLFSYPGFILFDAEGDTVAKEVVHYFGIGTESMHLLTIHPEADLTSSVFTGHLELWTNFYEELACTFDLSFDLCPDTCFFAVPNIQNVGGGMAIGTYAWTIDDGTGPVATGTLTMDDTWQYDADTVCLPPGQYSMTCIPQDEPTGGQVRYGVSRPYHFYYEGPSEPLVWSGINELDFAWHPRCAALVEALPEAPATSPVQVIVADGSLTVRRTDGRPLGAVEVHDARGRVLFQGTASADRLELRTAAWNSGLVLVRAAGGTHRATIVR